MKLYEKINKEFDLLEYIFTTEGFFKAYGISKDSPSGMFILNMCPICRTAEPHFILYDDGYEERGEYTWSSPCVEEGKIFKSIDFIQYYKRLQNWKAALNYTKANLLKDKQQKEPQYLVNTSGSKLKVYDNLKVLLEQYGITVKFNELKKKIEIDGSINVQGSYDSSITKLNTLCQVNELKLSKDQQYDFMYCVAIDNKFNSVVKYLASCRNLYLKNRPVNPVINDLFKTIKYTNADEVEFNNKILLKALMGYIHMAHNTGTSFVDFFIVLKGKQGIGKTQWIKSLMPKEHLNEFFKEGVILKLGDKDNIIQNTCYWIVELGEFGKTLRESDRDEMKAFICKSTDEYRIPYARTSKTYPRHTVFIATVNDDEFLRDATGDRRYAVFEVDSLNFQHDINVCMLWGELMILYESGEYSTYLTHEETQQIMDRNRKFTIRSNEQILIEECLPSNQPKEEWRPVTISALAKYIEEETGRKLDCRKLGKAMRACGYEQKRIGHEGIRAYIAPHIEDVSWPF